MQKLLLLCLLLAGLRLIAQTTTQPTTIIVAQDGSGRFNTIQEAVNSIRDLSVARVKIFIKKGVYKEKLVIPSWKTNIASFSGSESAGITLLLMEIKHPSPLVAEAIRGAVQWCGMPVNTHGVYGELVKEVAGAAKVPLIDFQQLSGSLLEAFGDEDPNYYFSILNPANIRIIRRVK